MNVQKMSSAWGSSRELKVPRMNLWSGSSAWRIACSRWIVEIADVGSGRQFVAKRFRDLSGW